MSQKQLDALARGRENSLKKRQAKASTKKEIANEPMPSPEVKEKKVEQQHVQFVDKQTHLTKKDVEDISVDAITKYDAIRKQRKQKKKEVKKTHVQDQKTVQAINRALNPNDMDFYGDCFNITY